MTAHQLLPEDILARNPQIDREKLEEAGEMLRRLRERGVRRKGYDLASPLGGHRAEAQDDLRVDSRTVHLRD